MNNRPNQERLHESVHSLNDHTVNEERPEERPEDPTQNDIRPCESGDTYRVNRDILPYAGRPIIIEPLNFGYVVKIGCQSFALETKESLIEKLTKYINDPKETEHMWLNEYKL